MKKEIKFWIFVFIFFVGIAIGVWCSARFVYDGIQENKETSYNGKLTSKEVYNVGDKVKVTLAEDLEKDFYVLNADTKVFTLIAVDSIGRGRFNVDTNGNEYKGSIIESSLAKATSSWVNADTVRLVTVDELRETGLIEEVNDCVETADCSPETTPRIKKGSWLYSNYSYWTMSKFNTDKRYVYIVKDNEIMPSIVGYDAGNENGKVIYEIRPVIEINKSYVK